MRFATITVVATAALLIAACGESRKPISLEHATPSVIRYEAPTQTIVARRPALPKDYVAQAVATSPSGIVVYHEAPVITVFGTRRAPAPAVVSSARRARERAACKATPKAPPCI